MIWRMVKREILDHLLSLRFSLSVICILFLVIVGTIGYSYKNKGWFETYEKGTKMRGKFIRGSVEELATGPFFVFFPFFRKPSPMGFCAIEDTTIWHPLICVFNMPMDFTGAPGYLSPTEGVKISVSALVLDYYTRNVVLEWEGLINLFSRSEWESSIPKALRIDWVFIVGIIGSLMAFLFTYDAISGERESGTLKLILSNPISRSGLLLGKLFGSISVLFIAIGFGWIISLLILAATGIPFWKDPFSVLMIPILSLLYLLLFVSLGLLISSLFRTSSSSLVVLLMIWAVFVVIMPGISALRYKRIKLDFETMRAMMERTVAELNTRYKDRMSRLPEIANLNNRETANFWREYVKELERMVEEGADKRLDRIFSSMEHARRWARLSPVMLYRYSVEALAGTGFPRYKEFVMNVRGYMRDRTSYLKRVDAEDPESPHVLRVKGGMSKKEAVIPIFTDRHSALWAMKESAWDVGIIAALVVLVFLLSYFSFMRADVR
jgi:ABC-type transport system involved in multi-copper enzyme maturation permease subunit